MARRSILLAATAGIVLSVGTIEVVLRIAEPAQVAVAAAGPPDSKAKAGKRPVDEELQRYRSELNSYKYHDHEWRLRQARGSWRTVVLGDSFTEGKRVARDDLFTERVETNFNQLGGELQSYEFLNVAHAGWGTKNELIALESLIDAGATFDSVLLVYFINDATAIESNAILVEALEKQNQAERSWSRTWDWIRRKLDREELTALTLGDYRDAFDDNENLNSPWNRSKNALKRMRDLSLKHDFGLGVVMFPVLADLSNSHELVDSYEKVGETCRELGLPFRSLLPGFKGYEAQELWVSPRNAHANARGHAIAAEAISAFLVEEGLVPLTITAAAAGLNSD